VKGGGGTTSDSLGGRGWLKSSTNPGKKEEKGIGKIS